jgi:hypothetical protein
MVKPLAILAATCAALISAKAQTGGAAQVYIRALAFTPDLQVAEAFVHDPAAPAEAAAAPVEIKTYLNHEGSMLELKGRQIVFTRKPERASLKNDADKIAEVTLPQGARSAILLFMPGEAGAAGKSRVILIPDTRRDFPSGSFRVSNLSSLPVQIKLENKPYNFRPAETKVITDAPMGASQQAVMEAVAFVEGKERRVASTRWHNPGDKRVLQFIYPNAATGQLEFRAFDDIPPRDVQPQAATAP